MPVKQLQFPELNIEVNGEEILRVYITDKKNMDLTLRRAFDDPGTWGRLFVDIAHHVARAYGDVGVSPHIALESIRDTFIQEFNKPGIGDTFVGKR